MHHNDAQPVHSLLFVKSIPTIRLEDSRPARASASVTCGDRIILLHSMTVTSLVPPLIEWSENHIVLKDRCDNMKLRHRCMLSFNFHYRMKFNWWNCNDVDWKKRKRNHIPGMNTCTLRRMENIIWDFCSF